MLICILAVALLAVDQPASAKAFDQILARNTGQPTFAPLVFHNLTKDEFMAKRQEVRRNRPNNGDAVSFLGQTPEDQPQGRPAHLAKRAVLGLEWMNDFYQQAVLEQSNAVCVSRYGDRHRVTSGSCVTYGSGRHHAFRLYCKNLDGDETPRCQQSCGQQKKCSIIQVYNYKGREVQMPLCDDELQINQRVSDNGADTVPTYEGHQHVPDLQSPPHSPSVLDHIDQFWAVEDGHIPGVAGLSGRTAQWDYRGTYSNGNGFRSQSLGMAHSWSCIGCPSGDLYVQTVGFKSTAYGSVFT